VSTRLVVVGGSAGALEPLRTIVRGLSDSFDAPLLVCLHVAAGSNSRLPELLASAGRLPTRHARNGDPLKNGVILVAPPDRHLVVHEDVVMLSRGPKENRHRPSVDALFNSAARWHGPDVIGIVLSGALDDGASGAAAIAAQDGTVIVQDPEEAKVAAMPLAAARAVRRAKILRSPDIADLLYQLLGTAPASSSQAVLDPLVRWESENVDSTALEPSQAIPGNPAALGCPDCHGGMFESTAPERPPHYICHVGHSWSPESLMEAQRQASEASLYGAAAKLLEEATVLRRLARLPSESGMRTDPAELEDRATQAERQARQIQAMVHGPED
jgi:two-component system chemotaxis response regulator CheB